MDSSWHVYIVRCADHSLYTGIATDVARRVLEHNENDKRAARYTRARRPVQLVYSESVPDRSSALKREHQLRRLGRTQKEILVAKNQVS